MIELDEQTLHGIVVAAKLFMRGASPDIGQAPVPVQTIDVSVTKAISALIAGASAAQQAMYKSEAVRQIQDGLRLQIADEAMLVDGPRVDWYVGERKQLRPLWNRYKTYLSLELSFSPNTVASIDRSSDRIVEYLGDPSSQDGFDRRGLVVGQVQSGKTTSYAALINKAIDAGYDVVVVLTGVHESLRVQTQKRMEESVRGIASDTGRSAGAAKGTPLRLAQIKPISNPPHFFTTRAVGGDFSAEANLYANSLAGTHVFIVKKNVKILRQLALHFDSPAYAKVRDPNNGKDEIAKRSLLIVDDEADNASVDVNRPDPTDRDHDPTAINRAIRKLLVKFRRRAYVGYTATPYANILIHKDNSTDGEGRDLFPEDFIVMLPAPSNYVGPAVFFGGASAAAENDCSKITPPLLRYVTDCGQDGALSDWMPRGHKLHHVPKFRGAARIPVSLEDAVMSFVIATSIRRIRGWKKTHNSMLVHVSRFKQVQGLVRDAIGDFLYELKGVLADEGGACALAGRFDQLYTSDFVPTESRLESQDRGPMPSLDDLKLVARDVLDCIKVWTINSTASNVLEYDEYPNGLNVVCVGGDKLSRGLTLDGLTVSYFLRASRMYDTLMQMGRWFGYRPGYKDLCRLYLTKELGNWFEHIVRADEELRGEFLTLQDERRRPADFGLRVRSHPTLLVTAPAKMSSTEKFELKFGGRVTQTIHFYRDPTNLRHNAECVAAFLLRISGYADGLQMPARRDPVTGELSGQQPLPGRLYVGVSIDDLKGFLESFRFHPESRSMNAPELLQFLSKLKEDRVHTEWSVLVASAGTPVEGDDRKVLIAPGLAVNPVQRATKPPSPIEWNGESELDPITLGVLASPTDLIADLRPSEVVRLASIPPGRVRVDPAEGEHAARSRACRARDPEHCLLVIYVVEPIVAIPSEFGDKTQRIRVGLAPGSAHPIGLVMALPGNEKMPPVSYVVNSVEIDQLERQFEAEDQRGGVE